MTRRFDMRVAATTPRHRVAARAVRHLPAVITACVLMMTFAAVSAFAGAYVGFGAGTVMTTVDKASVEFHTLDWKPGASIVRPFAGYRMNEYLGIEGGYMALGKARVQTSGGDFFEASVSGFEITPTGSLPIVRDFSAIARAGLVVWQSDIRYQFTSLGSGTRKESGSSLVVALGAEYVIGKHVLVRGEGAYYAIDKGKAGAGDDTALTLSAGYAF